MFPLTLSGAELTMTGRPRGRTALSPVHDEELHLADLGVRSAEADQTGCLRLDLVGGAGGQPPVRPDAWSRCANRLIPEKSCANAASASGTLVGPCGWKKRIDDAVVRVNQFACGA